MATATAAPASGAESTRAEQIISNFYHKALHIVLHSRIPNLVTQRPRDPRPTKRDRWFNLAVGEHPTVLETLNFWNRGGGVNPDPMVVDIILSRPSDRESVIERWIVEHRRVAGTGADVYAAYKKGIVLLRSMYSMLRLLPAYKAYRTLSSSNQNYSFSLNYKVSSFTEPFEREEEKEMKQHCFGSVETQFGQIGVSVAYRRCLKEFDLEGSPLILPRIISDYVGSPAADPLRSFPSSLLAASSFPFRNSDLGAVQSTRPHSWTSPPMKYHPLAQGAEQTATSPINFSGRQYAAAHHLRKTLSSGCRKGSIDISSEHKLSPPFSSSPSPSPPLHPNSPLRSRMQSVTAPVSIPPPSRSLLPPPSPRHTRTSHSSGESPSEGRSYRKMEDIQVGDLYPNITSPSQKGVKDGKDDCGHFSGIFPSCGSPKVGFSRSSSRLSSEDFADDSELFCHFALDDIDTSESQNRNTDGNEALGSSQPYFSQKSQDAAVGVLVQMFRSAPPLRHDSISSQSAKSELGEDLGSSCSSMSRKTSDALEELRSYKEIKDMLLSRSGTDALELHQSKLKNSP